MPSNTFLLGVVLLWRGSLLPLGCEAPPKAASASQPSGSKLPRHTQQTPAGSSPFSLYWISP
ncbi:hypothetical protein DYL61_20975 [Pseudomonas nabeulensis]|uniref:Uncharacterized protein n=1 Tax=Pseudomonas nabeulensis TaxID=2293833 RepID=A0A4Z0AVN4_9PSED|nr:hypothetical protein DYL61_20975 [Pseudomonas nabeulensis]